MGHAERSFQHFTNRFCFVGHTHVPVIFQQPDPIANIPTSPLGSPSTAEPISSEKDDGGDDLDEQAVANDLSLTKVDERSLDSNDDDSYDDQDNDLLLAAIRPTAQTAKVSSQAENEHLAAESRRYHS